MGRHMQASSGVGGWGGGGNASGCHKCTWHVNLLLGLLEVNVRLLGAVNDEMAGIWAHAGIVFCLFLDAFRVFTASVVFSLR